MSFAKTVLALLSAAPFAAEGAPAHETIKVGLVAEFSGPFARYGTQMHNGIKVLSGARTPPAPHLAQKNSTCRRISSPSQKA